MTTQYDVEDVVLVPFKVTGVTKDNSGIKYDLQSDFYSYGKTTEKLVSMTIDEEVIYGSYDNETGN